MDGAETLPEVAFASNGAGLGHLADASVRNGACLVHVSTLRSLQAALSEMLAAQPED